VRHVVNCLSQMRNRYDSLVNVSSWDPQETPSKTAIILFENSPKSVAPSTAWMFVPVLSDGAKPDLS
jgi:hypothetical protein